MKLFKKTVAALATVAALTGAGSAHAFLQDWTLDTNGAAAGGQIVVGEYLDLVGTSYIHNTFSNATNFNFQEAGTFTSHLADGLNTLPSDLKSTFVGTGSGTLGVGGGSLTFGTGTLNVYDSLSNLIGTFGLQSGSANLLPNSVLPNGTISLTLTASFLAPGYFFQGANDLADELGDGALVFGFATTNASLVTSGTTIATSLAANGPMYAAAFGSAPSLTNYGHDNLVVGNNGQYRLQVPEPASLALVGVALLGLGSSVRRRKSAE